MPSGNILLRPHQLLHQHRLLESWEMAGPTSRKACVISGPHSGQILDPFNNFCHAGFSTRSTSASANGVPPTKSMPSARMRSATPGSRAAVPKSCTIAASPLLGTCTMPPS